jgi:hypothetical protein
MKTQTLIILALLGSTSAFAAEAAPSRGPASLQQASSSHEVDKPLRVTGQTRNLSMMLVLKGDKDKVKFQHVRRSYKDKLTNDTKF